MIDRHSIISLPDPTLRQRSKRVGLVTDEVKQLIKNMKAATLDVQFARMLTMDKHQQAIDDWAQQLEEPYWPPLSILARVTEEVGELARLLNHLYGPKKKKPEEAKQQLGEEIADILFALVCLANQQQINLDKELDKVLAKATTRDKARFKRKA